MNHFISAFLIAVLSLSGLQQNPSVQIVTTADGRKVELKPDGTWVYLQSAPTPAPVTTSSIEFQAAILLRNSEVRPVARAEFFLLDQDLNTLLTNAGFKTGWLNRRNTPANTFWHLVAGATTGNLLGGQNDLAIAREAVNAHVVAKTMSDFNGKGKFENVKPGKYFLIAMHYHQITKQTPCWELPVTVTAGQKAEVIFDTNNVTSWGY